MLWERGYMARIERIDSEDSFETLFKIELGNGRHQEVRVPIFMADFVETQINAGFNFDQERLRKGSKTVLD